MTTLQLQALLTILAMILIPAGFGGAGFIALREAGLRARRRSRLSSDNPGPGAVSAGAQDMVAGVIDRVRQVGDRIAIQDPARISVLRSRLIQAGFFSREAVTLYLGGRAVALVLATGATM